MIREYSLTTAEHGHDHGHSHGDDHDHDDHVQSHHSHERPGSLPLQIPSPVELEPQIAMDSIDVNSDRQSADGGHKEHRHKVSNSDNHRDYGIAGVLIHIAGDAFNNIGVIIAGLVIWKSTSPNRYYADPTVSMAIAIIILLSAVPLGESCAIFDMALTAYSEANRSHPAAEPTNRN
jgi:zinc transporter 1